MPRPKLYGKDPKELKWGIGPGEHVTHIVTDDMQNMTILNDGSPIETSGYEAISQKELYSTDADKKTSEYFMTLAEMSANDYQDDDLCEGSFGREYKGVLENIKAYITAGRQSTQQQALKTLKSSISQLAERVKNEIQKSSSDPKLSDPQNQVLLRKLAIYDETLNGMTRGNLKIHDENYHWDEPEEPDNTILGKAAIWVPTDEELFPHDPSPNDIKQGYGVEDCFMLSSLAVKAAKDPQYIKDMMKDNGNGIVTVRFYNSHRQPIYIDVKKTVNKTVGGGSTYASGALWVQMLEKAYVQYVDYATNYENTGFIPANSDKRSGSGYSLIDRGSPHNFLNAFEGKMRTGWDNQMEEYSARGQLVPSMLKNIVYGIDEKGRALCPIDRDKKGYLKFEERLFEVYSKHVNDEKKILTVGIQSDSFAKSQFFKKHGLRVGHAYGIMKTFEKDGKKFVQLRDPYATFKPQYNKDHNLIQNGYGPIPGAGDMLSGIVNGGTDDRGTFNMEFADFLNTFNTLSGYEMEFTRKMSSILHGKVRYEPDETGKKFHNVYEDDHRAELYADFYEKLKPYTKEDEDIEFNMRPKEDRELYDRIFNADGSGCSAFRKQLKNLCDDLKSTDAFFTWPNSKQFNKMRDAAYKMYERLGKINPTMATLNEKADIVDELNNIKELAAEYEKKKIADLKEAQKAKKDPSARFIHRLVTATNLGHLIKGDTEAMVKLPNMKEENLGILVKDINTKIDRINSGEIKIKNTEEIDRMRDTVEIIDKIVNKQPAVTVKGKFTKAEVSKAENGISDFEVLDKNELTDGVVNKNKAAENTGENKGKTDDAPERDLDSNEFDGFVIT